MYLACIHKITIHTHFLQVPNFKDYTIISFNLYASLLSHLLFVNILVTCTIKKCYTFLHKTFKLFWAMRDKSLFKNKNVRQMF